MTLYSFDDTHVGFICVASVCCPLSMSFYYCYNLRKTNDYYSQRKELLNWINEEDDAYIVNGEQNKMVIHQRINRSL